MHIINQYDDGVKDGVGHQSDGLVEPINGMIDTRESIDQQMSMMVRLDNILIKFTDKLTMFELSYLVP